MKSILAAFALTTILGTAHAGGEHWTDGTVTYKFSGIDTHFPVAADACKAGVDDLAKHGNHKTFKSVKDGTTTTMMTCVLAESDGTPFEQTNVITKILECPAGSTAKSTDNSGDFAKIRCQCDDPKKGCPAAPKKQPAKAR
jgi:hypothetical protein